jgi:Family of unknown function (DUF6900)
MTLSQKLEAIARRHLHVVTLETRNSDALDFHDLSIWQLRRALEAAYNAGFEAGEKARRP